MEQTQRYQQEPSDEEIIENQKRKKEEYNHWYETQGRFEEMTEWAEKIQKEATYKEFYDKAQPILRKNIKKCRGEIANLLADSFPQFDKEGNHSLFDETGKVKYSPKQITGIFLGVYRTARKITGH